MSYSTRRFDSDACKALLERAGVWFRSGSVSFILACGVCGKSKLYVRKKDGRSVCFHCQEEVKGWADRVLAPIVGSSPNELAEVLYGSKGVSSTLYMDIEIADHFGDDDYGYEDDEVIDEALPTVYWPYEAFPLEHSWAEKGATYMESRGIPIRLAMQYDIRYIPAQKRVCFPVTQNGRMVGYQARYVGDTSTYIDENGFAVKTKIPKMLTVGKVGGKALMFDQNLGNVVIVAEGPFDAMKCHLTGAGWVATMGKGVTPKQIELILAKEPKAIYLALDPDAATDSGRILRELNKSNVVVYDLKPGPGYKDLGDMPAEEVAAAMETAPRLDPNHLFHYFRT